MDAQPAQGPWWASLTGDAVTLNHRLGYVMIAPAAPAPVALVAFVGSRAGTLSYAGPVVYLCFGALMLVVDYVAPVGFRSPPRRGILVPYLALFFGAILLMGLPMERLERSLWSVTVVTTVLLVAAMVAAMRKGMG